MTVEGVESERKERDKEEGRPFPRGHVVMCPILEKDDRYQGQWGEGAAGDGQQPPV